MKKLISILAIAGISLPAFAGPLTPEEALSRTFTQMRKMPGHSLAIDKRPAYSTTAVSGEPVAYVFNTVDSKGYYIVAADDVAYPLLGYVEDGSFSADEMPPALKWWLEEYGRQIEFARSHSATPSAMVPKSAENADWEAIEPLITTKWNQDSPYNDMCPTVDGVLSVTGCVATSMAQLMNYFKYPDVGEGTMRYYCKSIGRNLTLNFSKREFDWDNMLDYYSKNGYTEEQGEAVAYLMKACGYSTEMEYSNEASGTQGELIARALKTYFKYDQNCRSVQRMPYSWNEWCNMIYDNLKNVGPLVVNGQSPLQGGHSFICDGYDGNGYFHFNWGWGGVSDGYFALDALNPDAQGIGGYAGGFNFHQSAIVGVQKPTGLPVEQTPDVLVQYGATIGEVADGYILFDVTDSSMLGWGCAADHQISVKIGASFQQEGSDEAVISEGVLGSMKIITIEPGAYYPSGNAGPKVEIPDLKDGRYKVTLVSSDTQMENSGWQPVVVEWAYPNYVYLTVSGGKYSIENVPVPTLSVDESEVTSDVYFDCNFMLKAKISNSSDYELTQGVSPVLMKNGKVKYTGQSILVTLNPGEEKDFEWISKFDRSSGIEVKEPTDYAWGLINPQTNKMYGEYGTITMYPTPGDLWVSMSSIGVADCAFEGMTVDGSYFGKVFTVDNLEDFMFDLIFTVKDGYFDGQLFIDLCKVDIVGEYERNLIPIGDPVYQEYPFLSKGDVFEHHEPMSIKGGVDNELYAVRVQYSAGMRINNLGTIFLMHKDNLGVSEVSQESNQSVEYFNLNGLKVDNPKKGDFLIEKRGEKVRKIIF